MWSVLDPNVIMWCLTIMTNQGWVRSLVVTGPGAGEGATALREWSVPHPSFSSPVYSLSLSVCCFLTFQMLHTAKLEDKEVNHQSFIFENTVTSYCILNFGPKSHPLEITAVSWVCLVYRVGPCLFLL